VPHHEDIWRVDIQLHAFLTLALDGGKRAPLCSGHSTPRERALDWTLGKPQS